MILASLIESMKNELAKSESHEDQIETLSTIIIELTGSMVSTPYEPGGATTRTDANAKIDATVAAEIAPPGLQKESYRRKVVFIKLKDILKVLSGMPSPPTTDVGLNIYPTVNNYVSPATFSCVLELAYYDSVITYAAPFGAQNTHLFNFGTAGGNKLYSQLNANY